MTRAQGPAFEIEYRSAGPAGASRTVMVLRSGALALLDPAPHLTAHHDLRLLLVEVEAPEMDDPPTFGGETPAGSTAAEVLALLREEVPSGAVSLVGERSAAMFAVALAATLGGRVDRLALVAAPLPDGGLACDLMAATLARVPADTVVINAAEDATAPESSAQWYADHLPSARADIVTPAGVHTLDGRLALSHVWDRVLDHLGAPSTAA
jgi:pimeloyl-ACP methyl ester carboxylesterase